MQNNRIKVLVGSLLATCGVTTLLNTSAHATFSLTTSNAVVKSDKEPTVIAKDSKAAVPSQASPVAPVSLTSSVSSAFQKAESLKREADAALVAAELQAKSQRDEADAALKRFSQLRTPVLPSSTTQSASTQQTTSSMVEPHLPKPLKFDVRVADGNLRNTVERWSTVVGWQLHWQVDRDFPTLSKADYSLDFKDSITNLMFSTSGSDFEIKPCFHSNNVVRIVRQSVDCATTPQVSLFPVGSK